MSLRFTSSKDGLLRASFVIRHRVDRGDLVLAAALLLDQQLAGQDYDRAEAIAATLTSRAIEEKLREELASKGDDWGMAADERSYAWADDQWDHLADLGAQVVDELY